MAVSKSMRFFGFFFVLSGLLLVFTAAAQTTYAVTQATPTVAIDLTTVAGIIAAATLSVEVLKRLLSINSMWIKPLNAVVAAIYVVVANLVFKTLPGDLFTLLSEIALATIGSTGLYEYARQLRAPKVETAAKALMLPLLLVGIIGCSTNTQTREGMAAVAAPIHAEYKAWMLDKQTDGVLTANDVAIRQRSLDLFNEILETSRKGDR